MSEQDNVNLIQKVYTAFGNGDIQTILNSIDPGAEWVNHGPSAIPYAGDFTGRVPAFFQALAGSIIDGKVVPVRFVSQSDSVVALGRYTATVQRTGAKIDTPIVHLWTIRNGKVTGFVSLTDSAAVAAAHSGTAASATR